MLMLFYVAQTSKLLNLAFSLSSRQTIGPDRALWRTAAGLAQPKQTNFNVNSDGL